jgi:hypothetical protein
MSQLALPFDWPAAGVTGGFIMSAASASAVRHLDHPALWPVMATILTGPRKSGRSSLARIFAAKTGGDLCDDADRCDEEALFHRWNSAQERRRPLLIVADARPPEWRVTLPDLRSRLAATPHVAIGPPDDALLSALIERGLAVRGLPWSPELMAHVLPRIERSYVAAERVVDALDQAALATRRRLGIATAKRVLAEAGITRTRP